MPEFNPGKEFEDRAMALSKKSLVQTLRRLLMANWVLVGVIEEAIEDHDSDCACDACIWIEAHLTDGVPMPNKCPHMLGEDCPFCDPEILARMS